MTTVSFTAKARKPFLPPGRKPKKKPAPRKTPTMYDTAGLRVKPLGLSNPADLAAGDLPDNIGHVQNAVNAVRAERREVERKRQAEIDAVLREAAAYDASLIAKATRLETEEQDALALAEEERLTIQVGEDTIETYSCKTCDATFEGPHREVEAVMQEHRCPGR